MNSIQFVCRSANGTICVFEPPELNSNAVSSLTFPVVVRSQDIDVVGVSE